MRFVLQCFSVNWIQIPCVTCDPNRRVKSLVGDCPHRRASQGGCRRPRAQSVGDRQTFEGLLWSDLGHHVRDGKHPKAFVKLAKMGMPFVTNSFCS